MPGRAVRREGNLGQGEVDYYSTLLDEEEEKKQEDEEGRLAMIPEHLVRIWVVYAKIFWTQVSLGIIVPGGKNKKSTHNENCPRLRSI